MSGRFYDFWGVLQAWTETSILYGIASSPDIPWGMRRKKHPEMG